MIKRTKFILIRAIEILVVVFVLVVSSSYIYFRYFSETTFRPSEPLSASLSTDVNTSLDSIDIINGVQIVKVDLKRNVRYLIHTYWKTAELQQLYDEYSSSRITAEIPIFTKDEVENARIVKLMNHQFECVPHVTTLTYKLVPKSAEYVAVTCTISIPPAFDEFKGIISVSLSRVPTELEKAAVRSVLSDISGKIYQEIK